MHFTYKFAFLYLFQFSHRFFYYNFILFFLFTSSLRKRSDLKFYSENGKLKIDFLLHASLCYSTFFYISPDKNIIRPLLNALHNFVHIRSTVKRLVSLRRFSLSFYKLSSFLLMCFFFIIFWFVCLYLFTFRTKIVRKTFFLIHLEAIHNFSL